MRKIFLALLVLILTFCQSSGENCFGMVSFNNNIFNKTNCNQSMFDAKNFQNAYAVNEPCCCSGNFSTTSLPLPNSNHDQLAFANQLTQGYGKVAYLGSFNCCCRLENAYNYSFLSFNLNIKPIYNYRLTFTRQVIAVNAEYNLSYIKALDKTNHNITGFGSQTTYLFKNSFLI